MPISWASPCCNIPISPTPVYRFFYIVLMILCWDFFFWLQDTFHIGSCLAPANKYPCDFLAVSEQDLYVIDVPLMFSVATSGYIHGLAFWFDLAFKGSKWVMFIVYNIISITCDNETTSVMAPSLLQLFTVNSFQWFCLVSYSSC